MARISHKPMPRALIIAYCSWAALSLLVLAGAAGSLHHPGWHERRAAVERLVDGQAIAQRGRSVSDSAPMASPVVEKALFDTDIALADFLWLRQIVLTAALVLVAGALVATRLTLANQLLRRRLVQQGSFDLLTGLHNRRYYTDVMISRIATARRSGLSTAILLIDLDGFKQINELRGFSTGDAVLRQVADRLVGCAGKGNAVIRLGGDEFAIVQTGHHQHRQVVDFAQRVLTTLAPGYCADGSCLNVGASIGAAHDQADQDVDRRRFGTGLLETGIVPEPGSEMGGTASAGDLHDLLHRADVALQFVKSAGGGAFQIFDPEMERISSTRRALEIDLGEALGRNQLEVFFQPLVKLEPRRVIGFEALLRWHHPTMGPVPPSTFIPVAERTGLMDEIGGWVLRRACLEASGWPGGQRVAVNLSPKQFERTDVVETVAAALLQSGLDPDRLELEITEGVVMRDVGDALAVMRRLRALGVRLALDDFGTGYSSLSYLRSFPFDKVKIDGSFLGDLYGDGGKIVRAVLELCRHLRLEAVVEGVEQEEQLQWLRAEGCTEVQGHLFSPARPACRVPDVIASVLAQVGSVREVSEAS